MSIKRWTTDDRIEGHYVCEAGEWVSYKDVKKLEDKCQELHDKLKQSLRLFEVTDLKDFKDEVKELLEKYGDE